MNKYNNIEFTDWIKSSLEKWNQIKKFERLTFYDNIKDIKDEKDINK